MLNVILASLSVAASCPPIDFGSIDPPEGSQYVYSLWRDGEMLPALYRIDVTRSEPGRVRVEETFFLVNQEWTEPKPNRVIGGVILREEDAFNGVAARQLRFDALEPPLEDRSLAVGEVLRLPVVQTATSGAQPQQRNRGEYILSHAGCSELIGEGRTIQTRMLRVSYPRYIGRGTGEWRLTEVVQIYHLPVGERWFYAVHREGNHPMRQGTILQGYTAP